MTERRSRLAERSVLLNPLPLVFASTAIFLAVLVLLTARMATGNDPAFRQSASTSVLAMREGGRTVLRTSASGASTAVPASAGGAGARAARHAAIVTRTSGGGVGGEHDD